MKADEIAKLTTPISDACKSRNYAVSSPRAIALARRHRRSASEGPEVTPQLA